MSLRETVLRVDCHHALGLTPSLPELFSARMSTPAPDAAKRLVDRFDQNHDAYLSGSYNAAHLVEDADGRQLTADGPGGGR